MTFLDQPSFVSSVDLFQQLVQGHRLYHVRKDPCLTHWIPDATVAWPVSMITGAKGFFFHFCKGFDAVFIPGILTSRITTSKSYTLM